MALNKNTIFLSLNKNQVIFKPCSYNDKLCLKVTKWKSEAMSFSRYIFLRISSVLSSIEKFLRKTEHIFRWYRFPEDISQAELQSVDYHEK